MDFIKNQLKKYFIGEITFILLFSLIVTPALSQTNKSAIKFKTHEIKNLFSQSNRYALLNINNVTSWVRADGQLSRSPNNSVGTHFPRGTAAVVYQDGFVWGGKAYIDPDMTQPAPFHQLIRVGGSTYNTGTRSGRIIGKGVAATSVDPNSSGSRIYRIRRDYFLMSEYEIIKDAAESHEINPAEVTFSQIQEIKNNYARDWIDWPVQFGAPFIDRNNNDIYDPPPKFTQDFSSSDLITGNYDEPGIAAGNPQFPADQVIWTVFNDLDSDATHAFSDSEPLGLELQLTQWAFQSNDDWNGIYYRKLKIINKGGVVISEDGSKGSFWIDSMYVCLWSDGDLGDHSDDLVGSDPELNLVYYYNDTSLDKEFRKFNLPPPTMGYLYLQGPRIPAQGKSAFFDGKSISGWKNLPISSFTYNGTGNPFTSPYGSYETNTIFWYKILKGFAPLQGPDRLYMFPPGINPTFFPLSGDPVTGTGHIDGIGEEYAYRAGDRRTMITSGPFALAPGDTQEVVIAFVAGMGANRLSSISVMKHVARQLQHWYPFHPSFEIVPEDPPVSADPPYNYHLSQNYPNPFHKQTTIEYTLPQPAFLEIKIYNLLGKEVAVLESGYKEIGTFQVSWDGRDLNGKLTPSGVYIYKLKAGHINLYGKLFKIM